MKKRGITLNWNKVLNVFIIIFLGFNLLLFMNQKNYESERYVMSDSRVRQMERVLNERGIGIYTYIPGYYPQTQLRLESPTLDKDNIIQRVLGEVYESRLDNDYFAERIFNEDQELTFYMGEQKGMMYYKLKDGAKAYAPEDLTDASIRKVILQFSEDLFGEETNMQPTYWKEVDGEGYRIELNESYKGNLIFQSYIKLYITMNGIEEALAIRYKPIEFSGDKQNVYPFDEVIYNLMYYLEEEYSESQIEQSGRRTIRYIDVGYYVVDEGARNLTFRADPYYRVIFEDGDVYYINAYSNVIYKL